MTFSFTVPCLACYDEAEDDFYDYYTLDTDGDGVDDLWVVTDEDGHGIGYGYYNDEGIFECILIERSDNESDDEGKDDECGDDESLDDEDYPEEENEREIDVESSLYDDVEDTSQEPSTRLYSTEQELEWAKQISPEIEFVIEKLQEEGKIREKPDTENCHYDPREHCIYVPLDTDFTTEALTHEILHYKQDELHMLDSDFNSHSSDNEYQAYLLNYWLLKACGDEISEPKGTEDTTEWNDFKEKISDEIGKTDEHPWYSEQFLEELNNLNHESLSESFRDYYQEKDEYRESIGEEPKYEVCYKWHDENYNWNWEELLNSIGFIKKIK